MSRHPRDYPVADRYDDRESDFYRRPRRDRDYDDLEVDITRTELREPRRAEAVFKERDPETGSRRGPRQPDFLREDYGKSSTAGQLVLREEREEGVHPSALPRRRRSVEMIRSRAAPERVEEDQFVFRERERTDRGPAYPSSRRSEVDEEVVYRQRTRSRPPPPRDERSEDKIDISISRNERGSGPPPESRPPPARSEAPIEEIRFRRGGGDRPSPPRTIVDKTEIDIRERDRSTAPPRSTWEREQIEIRERRSPAPPPPRSEVDREEIVFRERIRSPPSRGREVSQEEIEIREERSAPPPRQRSMSRGALVARKEEEWIVRRPRTTPPRDYEKEEIIIRRQKERTPSPEPEPEPAPAREPTPEPSPPPPPAPIIRPPIIQEVITHHRHIDHGVERARSPTPPPAPAPPSPPPPAKEPREDSLEIEIRRKGTRNGRSYEEGVTFEKDSWERDDRQVSRRRSISIDRKRSVSVSTRKRSPSPARTVGRRYDDEMDAEADYYNRKIASRAYPGEAYNGATREWSLVDVPPGTERVRMDGMGGGAQEITWERYNGQRRGKFISGDRVYEAEFANGYASPPPLPPPPPPPPPPPAPAPPRERTETKEEIRITHEHRSGGGSKPKQRNKMWTEVTKDLVIKEAIDEMGYECEETGEHFYVMEYLQYEDVLRLVEITEEIKKERRDRIREIQWEREELERLPKMLPPPPLPAPPRSKYDERIYEREYIYDRDGRRYR